MSCEAVTVGGSALLAIENAGDHGVGVMDSEATHQRDGVFISAHGCGTTLQVEINLDDGATTPTQGEMHAVLLFVEGDDDFFEQGAQQFLFVARCSSRGLPDLEQIGAEREQAVALVDAQRPRSLLFTTCEFSFGRFQFMERFFPFRSEPAGHQPIVRIDSPVSTFGALRLVACPLDRQPPLRKRTVAINFKPLGRSERSLDTKWCQRSKGSLRHGLVDLHRADAEAVDTAAICDGLAGTMIAGGSRATRVVGAQLAAAMSAHGDALQQRAPFSHGAPTWLMRARMRIGGDPGAIGLVCGHVDEAFMVVRDKYRPLRSRQLAHAFLARTRSIKGDFAAALAIGIGARIDRIGEHMIDGDVARVDPTDGTAVASLQWKRQALAAEPEPDAAHRSEFSEASKDSTDGGADRTVWGEAHPPTLLARDETTRHAAPHFAASGLVENPAVKTRSYDMQLSLAHGALETEQQSIVEHRGMIDTVGIADEGVGEAAQIEQAIPIGVVAGEAGDFAGEHDGEMAEGDFSGEPGEAIALDDAGTGKPEVFVDNDNLLRRPAKCRRLGGQGVLALCRFAIVLDLRRRGLSEINVGGATQVRSADLGDVIHRSPPCVGLSRRLAR